jgi:hypothetical protein
MNFWLCPFIHFIPSTIDNFNFKLLVSLGHLKYRKFSELEKGEAPAPTGVVILVFTGVPVCCLN